MRACLLVLESKFSDSKRYLNIFNIATGCTRHSREILLSSQGELLTSVIVGHGHDKVSRLWELAPSPTGVVPEAGGRATARQESTDMPVQQYLPNPNQGLTVVSVMPVYSVDPHKLILRHLPT